MIVALLPPAWFNPGAARLVQLLEAESLMDTEVHEVQAEAEKLHKGWGCASTRFGPRHPPSLSGVDRMLAGKVSSARRIRCFARSERMMRGRCRRAPPLGDG